jgi:tetratricopeptide (TPR) repeat protein
MSANRMVWRSVGIAATVVLLGSPLSAATEAEQEALRRFEAGQYQGAIDAANANRGDPASTFIAAHAALRMEQSDRAREEFGRLESHGDRAWQLIGQAGAALLSGNVDQAAARADEAIRASGDNPYAHYERGMVASRQGDFGTASAAFSRAAELKSDFAYAHYYAGLAYEKGQERSKAGQHLRAFLDLAPNAPERSAVVNILRTLGG